MLLGLLMAARKLMAFRAEENLLTLFLLSLAQQAEYLTPKDGGHDPESRKTHPLDWISYFRQTHGVRCAR